MTTLQTAIRNLEGKAQVAKDHAVFHRQRAVEYDERAHAYALAIDAIREVMGEPA